MTGAPGPDGVLLIDKPAGLTSHAVVDRVRRATRVKRIGHGGTLDPFATGLLTLLLGRATRLLPFLVSDPKVYRATVRFGTATDTDDLTGDVIREAPLPEPARVDDAIRSLTGRIRQRPPAFSAKLKDGVRAYAAARRGKPLKLEPVEVVVHSWRVTRASAAELEVDVTCGGGTYVRALARDLGEAAGSAAHLTALRRLRDGAFDVDDAQPLDAIERDGAAIRPAVQAVAHLARQPLEDVDAELVVHGRAVAARVDGDHAALTHAGALLAVAVREGGTWRPKVVMRDA